MLYGEIEQIENINKSLPTYHYDDLNIGEGIISKKEARINIGNNHYLLIGESGSVFINKSMFWPLYLVGRKTRFMLVAREIR